MSAPDRWHGRESGKSGDAIVPQAILLWMREQERAEQSAFAWQADSEDGVSLESAPDGSAESEEVVANLLRAIENTAIAARLQSVVPPENGVPPGYAFAQRAQTARAKSTFREPEPAAGYSELTSDAAQESSEDLANLLRAVQSAEIATPGHTQAQQDDSAGSSAQRTETVQSPAPLSHEADISARSVSAPLEAPEIGKSFADPPHEMLSGFEGLNLEGATQPDGSDSGKGTLPEPVENAEATPKRVASAEATSISKLPAARANQAAAGQQIRQTGRISRRRYTDRQRSDYLLSIAGPSAAPQARAAEDEPEPAKPAPQLEPAKPAEPVPAIAATTVAEPKRQPAAKPKPVAELSTPSREIGDSVPKTPILARLGAGIGKVAATSDLINEGLDRAEMHLEDWFQKWFGPPDPRRSARVDRPPLVAYHWIVDVPQALRIANIGAGGLHLITKDRWSEGNIVSMTLQRTDKEKGSAESWIAVDFLVMRWCEDGMAGAFIPSAPGLAHTVAGRAANCADRKTLERFVGRLIKAAADRKTV